MLFYWFLSSLVSVYDYRFLYICANSSENNRIRTVNRFFLLITLVYTFLIPILFRLPYISRLKDVFYENTYFYLTLGYTGYFVLGYRLSRTELTIKQQIACYVIGIFGFLVTAGMTRHFSLLIGESVETFYEPISLNVLMEAVGIFVFGRFVLSGWKPSDRFCAWISKLPDCSFGAYLTHVFVLDVLHKIGLTTVTFNSAVSVILVVIIASCISFAVSYFLGCIPVFRKTIV